MVSLAISKEIVRSEDSELKTAGTLTLYTWCVHRREQESSGYYEPQRFPGCCSYFGKGKHWPKDCQCKRDTRGNLLPSGNEQRGPVSLRSRSKQCKLSSFGQPESAKQERKPKLSISDLIHATEGSAVWIWS